MSSRVILGGSHRDHPAGSAFAGKPAPDQIIQITCILRRRKEAPEAPEVQLSHEELHRLYGADCADIEAVENFAADRGYSVVKIDPAARSIALAGRLSELAADFNADLELRHIGDKAFRTRHGHLHIPEVLAERVEAVLGFDERPAAAPYHRVSAQAARSTSYTPPQVAQAYQFPAAAASNQTIALVELGGGFKKTDLRAYWKKLGIGSVSTTAISVDGALNAPTGDPGSADGEVALDIEVAGTVAPGARLAVYFAPNTDQGFLDAINAAIHDTVRKPSVISISWGGPENQWTPQALNAFNAAFHDAALLGISVCVAAGDNGSSDGADDGANHVDFPASSPWVLACGGTKLSASGGKIQSEVVWNEGESGGATGGGVSSHFSKPAYQSAVNVPKPTRTVNPTGRGVPDVAGDADPESGYVVIVDGQEGVIGGTSAVAPLWAGLIAVLNKSLGKNLGWFHPQLYGTLTQYKALHDITSGSNGAYHAQAGWDACTGLGSPDGQAMLSLLKQSSTK